MTFDRSQKIWTTVVVLALAGVLYVGANWFELVDEDQWIGMQGEARRNPYLAATRLLSEMGAQVKPIAASAELDDLPLGATLILGDRRLSRMPAARVQRIVEWVRNGGNLLVEAEQPRMDDPVLAAFGLGHVGLRWTPAGLRERKAGDPKGGDAEQGFGVDAEDLPMDDGSADPRRAQLIAAMRQGTFARVTFADGRGFNVRFTPYQNLRIKKPRANALLVRDAAGLRLVQFTEGRGRVTAISNFDFMTRRSLAAQDHAEFLWHLTGADQKKPVVLLAVRGNSGGLFKWLGENAWTVVITFLVLLAAWIARIVPRFGPTVAEAPLGRLSLAEHLRAVGRFIGRRGGWASLTKSSRERFLLQLHRERPGMSRLTGGTLVQAIEAATNIGRARIDRALFAEVSDRRNFVDVVRTLKAIEHAIAGPGLSPAAMQGRR